MCYPLSAGWCTPDSYSTVGFSFSFCVFWRGSAMEGPGLSFRGREARLVQPRVPVSHGRQARGSRQRASLPPVFQFSRPTRRGGWVFSRSVAGLKGISEGNDGGDVSKGLTARGFWPGICGAHLGKGPLHGTCRIILWTFHRLDGWGRGTRPVVRGLRPWLVSRACARAAGMSQGVESPDFSGAVPWVGSRGLPWVFGSSFDDVS